MAGWRHVTDLLDVPLVRAGDLVQLTVDALDVRVIVIENGK